MHFKRNMIWALLLSSGLTACGGDGDSSTSNGANLDNNTSTSTGSDSESNVETQSRVLQAIQGQVKDIAGDGLSNANIQATVTDETNSILITSTTQSNDEGFYQLSLPSELTTNAHQVHITAEKDGFVNAESRTTLQVQQVTLTRDQVLARIESVSIKKEDLDSIAVSASGEQTLKLTLLKSSSGKQRIVSGEAIAANDEEAQLGISIPVSGIADSVKVINGELAYFDSSNSQDIQSFPGEFRGFGETENQGEGVSYNRDSDQSEEYRLISSTFSQIKLTDQTGAALPLSEIQGASGASPLLHLESLKAPIPL